MTNGDPVAQFLLVITLILGLVLYFVPWIIAACRNHHQRSAILLLNLLLGWTGLGWIAAIIWAATAIPTKETPHA